MCSALLMYVGCFEFCKHPTRCVPLPGHGPRRKKASRNDVLVVGVFVSEENKTPQKKKNYLGIVGLCIIFLGKLCLTGIMFHIHTFSRLMLKHIINSRSLSTAYMLMWVVIEKFLSNDDEFEEKTRILSTLYSSLDWFKTVE